jgi:hypothetical protein
MSMYYNRPWKFRVDQSIGLKSESANYNLSRQLRMEDEADLVLTRSYLKLGLSMA